MYMYMYIYIYTYVHDYICDFIFPFSLVLSRVTSRDYQLEISLTPIATLYGDGEVKAPGAFPSKVKRVKLPKVKRPDLVGRRCIMASR